MFLNNEILMISPQNPFGGQPKEMTANPLILYDKLLLFGNKVLPQLWEFYLTLDKKVPRRDKSDNFYNLNPGCRVGPKVCSPHPQQPVAPPKEGKDNRERLQSFEFEVEAGKWTSR